MVELDQDALWNEIDFSDIEAKYAVPEPDFFSAVVIIDNLPIVDEAKAPKLLTVLKKIISKFGRIKEETLEMPQDKDKMSKG